MEKKINPIHCNFGGENFYVYLGNKDIPVSDKEINYQKNCKVIPHSFDEPPYFIIYVTDLCNINCRYCFNKLGEIHRKNKSPVYEMEQLKDFMKSLNCKDIYIRFFGGEPLLNLEWIQECVNCLNELEITFHYNIFTNGILLNDKIINFGKKNDFQFFISLGLPDESDKGQKYRDVVHENVKKILNKTSNVIGSIVWTPESETSIVDTIKFHFKTNIKYITFIFEWGNYFNDKSQIKVEKELKIFADFYIKNILEHNMRYLMIHPFIDYIRHIIFNLPLYYDVCAAGKTTAAIATDGTLYPCHCFSTHSGYECGSIQEKQWKKAFENYNVNNFKLCKRCEIKYICKSYCYADNFLSNKNIFETNSSKCYIEKKIFDCSAYIIKQLMNHPVEYKTLKKILQMEKKDNVKH